MILIQGKALVPKLLLLHACIFQVLCTTPCIESLSYDETDLITGRVNKPLWCIERHSFSLDYLSQLSIILPVGAT